MAMYTEYLENISHSNEVNGFNLNNNSTILLDSSVDLTRDYPVNLQEIPIDFNLENQKLVRDFKQDLRIHLDKLNELIDILYQIKFFNDEFHKGRSVKNMANYILDDDQLLVNHASFLLDMIDKFILLCKFKANNLVEFDDSKIKKEYNELSVDFREDEKYFYAHIYQPSENYDEDFLDNMSNLLVR
ncbi:hypothetical protein [Methanobrevibacter sp.]